MTWLELYEKALKIETVADADHYLELLIRWHMAKYKVNRDEATKIEKSNLGYFAGYYGDEVRERVERLFNCEHPVFGKISINGPPTSEQAFQMGIAMAAEYKHANNIS